MKNLLTLIAILIFATNIAKANYISYYLVHVGVDHTLKENKRQKEAKEKQLRNTLYETNNTNSIHKVKEKYNRIKERLNKLGLVLEGFVISSQAYPTLQQIYDNQKNIVDECRDSPYLIPLSIQSEIEFVDRAQMLIRFLTGLVLTYGDINQMKSGDRKMLLNHAIKQLDDMNVQSYTLLSNIRNHKASVALAKQRMKDWINRDKEIMFEIIQNAKDLGA